ncbi:MAG TPA: hypothetical protein VK821_09910, partial [Dehalococcoidia bacterium]|nr:hypothetical protein [Dehalococcoidia bacterium]
GKRNQPADTGWTDESRSVKYAGPPFHHPTNVGLSPNGEFYVSDGYRNCRVHKYAADGTLLFSWGEPGEGEGQFNLVHGVWEHKGKVYVCDRQNNRIQIFSPQGEYLDKWDGFLQPCKIYIDKDDVMYIAELGARVSILDLDGNVLGRWGSERSHDAGVFWAPHGIAVDSQGDLYVAEVLEAPACRSSPVNARSAAYRHAVSRARPHPSPLPPRERGYGAGYLWPGGQVSMTCRRMPNSPRW